MITLVSVSRTGHMTESTILLSTRSHHRFPIALLLSLLLSSVDPSFSFATISRLSTNVKMSRRPRNQASHRYAETKPTETKRRHLPGKVIRIYTDYATRLWKETNQEARDIVRSSKVAMALRQVKSMVATETGGAMDCVPAPDRLELVRACENVLQAIAANDSKLAKASEAALVANVQSPSLRLNDESVSVTTSPPVDDTTRTAVANTTTSTSPTLKPKRTRRSIGFGAVMGFAVACWVFSGNYIFTTLFTMMTVLGQLEYYRMVMNTGIYPARRISVVGACSMFLAALFTPDLHQIVLPISGLWAMVWFLTMRRRVTHIPEIATTFTGMFYLGYVPSFWVRIRLIGMGREPTRLAPLTGPMLRYLEAKGKTLPSFIPQAVHLPITTGAIFIFWTWLCLAFSDVGAYFVGRVYGKTKLGVIAPAAGATSPNKTVEGVVGGCALSAVLAILGAWVQRWPHPVWTGAIHGILLGLLGLLGDLTASMLKRDAGLKDFGDLLPEHGGIMDRVDSFIWAAPYS
jgi:phosphatidate cytidylyltransferase